MQQRTAPLTPVRPIDRFEDFEAEQSLVNLAFRDINLFLELKAMGITAKLFCDKSPARSLWQAFERLYRPPATELVLDDLLNYLEKNLTRDQARACEQYLDDATNLYISPGKSSEYQERLVRGFQRRESDNAAKLWHNRALDPDADPEATIREIEQRIGEIRLARTPLEIHTARKVADQRETWYRERLATGPDLTRLPYEITTLNEVTNGGFKRKRSTVVSALPGVGKSAFLQRECYWQAVYQQNPVLYISVEMDAAQWIDRALMQETGIPSYLIERGAFEPHQSRVFDALKQYGDSNLFIVDDPRSTTETIKRACEHVIRQAGDLVAVYVDYAQRLADRKNFKQIYEFMEHVSSELASIPRLYDCHLFAISRVKGNGEAFGGLQLEYDVDGWIDLRNKKAKEDLPSDQKSGDAEAHFKKQRGDVSGVSAPLYWHANRVRFTDPDTVFLEPSDRPDYRQPAYSITNQQQQSSQNEGDQYDPTEF